MAAINGRFPKVVESPAEASQPLGEAGSDTCRNQPAPSGDEPPPDEHQTARAKLAAAKAAFDEEDQRLTGLQNAIERCRSETWAVHSRLEDAEQTLAVARANAGGQALAYAFANGQSLDTQPVNDAEALVRSLTAEKQCLHQTAEAPDSELTQSIGRLRMRRAMLWTRLSETLVSSIELQVAVRRVRRHLGTTALYPQSLVLRVDGPTTRKSRCGIGTGWSALD
jgi:hypothetical protein